MNNMLYYFPTEEDIDKIDKYIRNTKSEEEIDKYIENTKFEENNESIEENDENTKFEENNESIEEDDENIEENYIEDFNIYLASINPDAQLCYHCRSVLDFYEADIKCAFCNVKGLCDDCQGSGVDNSRFQICIRCLRMYDLVYHFANAFISIYGYERAGRIVSDQLKLGKIYSYNFEFIKPDLLEKKIPNKTYINIY